MNWCSWADFWAMGGYAGYVWPAFGLTFGALALEWRALGRRAQRLLAADWEENDDAES